MRQAAFASPSESQQRRKFAARYEWQDTVVLLWESFVYGQFFVCELVEHVRLCDRSECVVEVLVVGLASDKDIPDPRPVPRCHDLPVLQQAAG